MLQRELGSVFRLRQYLRERVRMQSPREFFAVHSLDGPPDPVSAIFAGHGDGLSILSPHSARDWFDSIGHSQSMRTGRGTAGPRDGVGLDNSWTG